MVGSGFMVRRRMDSGSGAGGAERPWDKPGSLSEDRPSSSRAQRRILDLVVQTSGVELLQAYGIPAAPLPPTALSACPLPEPALGSSVSFSGTGLQGVLVLCMPLETLHRTTEAVAGTHQDRDWIRELCNQLMGRIKNRLVRYQVALRPGVPTVLDPPALRRMAGLHTDLAYVFRTLTGSVVVWLNGDFDRTNLVFSCSVDVVGEGDVVLF
jgi:hypothetical protein